MPSCSPPLTCAFFYSTALELAFERSRYMTSEGTMLLVVVQVSGMSSFDYNFSVIPSDLTATGGPGVVLSTLHGSPVSLCNA